MSRHILWVVILCGASACVDRAQEDSRPPELIVLDGANEINEATRNGILELNYRLESAYPAEQVTTSIEAVFKGDRWRPLTDDWLNPGNPSGYVRGWSSFLDGSKTPNTIAHVWSAEWKNEDNDLVIYSLRFDSAVPPVELFLERPDNRILKVTAAFVPKTVVNALRKQTGTDQPLR
ncbi:MAG TPA: hypothetical protein VFO58_24085 [Vicinamibacterales bacterium]|nr:hypothetical protein [Vicinamibacterales bacterium]